MAEEAATMLERTLARLREFGDPVCRGDCCWWTLSRAGRKPVRVSLFMDSGGDVATGWLCDLQEPATSIRHFNIRCEAEIGPLVEEIHGMLSESVEAPETAPDAVAEEGVVTRPAGRD
jgi:hypothetical protein